MKQHLRALALFLLFILPFYQYCTAQSYDLALRLNSIANSPVKYETSVPFNITVFNQGTLSVDSIDVICMLGPALQLGLGKWHLEF